MTLAPSTSPVTLNSFQGPSGHHAPKLSAAHSQACRTGSVSMPNTGQAAKWMLKQVQHDEVLREAAK